VLQVFFVSRYKYWTKKKKSPNDGYYNVSSGARVRNLFDWESHKSQISLNIFYFIESHIVFLTYHFNVTSGAA